MESRRRTQRVTLPQPITAFADDEGAYVIDASVNGVRLAHAAPFAERKPCTISLDWFGTSIEFVAELRWTNRRGAEYQSGFEIQDIDAESKRALGRLVEAYAGPRQLYHRHELQHGVWRKTATTDSRQPESGFTVASTESQHVVDSLRAGYSRGDPKLRERIRKIAELSIAHPERHQDM